MKARAGAVSLAIVSGTGICSVVPQYAAAAATRGHDDVMELTSGVLPAVDKVIEMGSADLKRLGVMGHSYGGFSTYGLITQTQRFQAAVAMAGLSDFISDYGQFDARNRYDDFLRTTYIHQHLQKQVNQN